MTSTKRATNEEIKERAQRAFESRQLYKQRKRSLKSHMPLKEMALIAFLLTIKK